eukprot:TRINITY_DN9462_c0_g1_i1.p1 TRINITY_DN9462_c0_g1~~TRINITY_DN9462_c0_g1_i1.p1  ORF type:complete len:102 (+),score=34.15 TRINITY_DN9462_c0_g1_i1:82-387(+)
MFTKRVFQRLSSQIRRFATEAKKASAPSKPSASSSSAQGKKEQLGIEWAAPFSVLVGTIVGLPIAFTLTEFTPAKTIKMHKRHIHTATSTTSSTKTKARQH